MAENVSDAHDLELVLGGRRCLVHVRGKGPLVFLPTASFGRDPVSGIVSSLDAQDRSYTLLALVSDDWDGDYSPWRMEMSGRNFGGNGLAVLSWFLDTLLPYARENYPNDGTVYVAGYSLAGLFALWSFYETNVFSGVACCSGSLWFDGWDDYVKDRKCASGSKVYLSIGGKEPGSGPYPVRTIGGCYQRQKDRVSRQQDVRLRYEMNPGGHFSDPDGRVAKGISFLLG